MEYKKLVEVYEAIEKTTKRLEKTFIISELLKKSSVEDLDRILLLSQGKIFPQWDERKIGVAARLMLKAINIATGVDTDKVEKEWKKTGDIGKTAENLTKVKKQATLFSQSLSVKKVFDNLRKLVEAEGKGAVERKVRLIAELLSSASSSEAKYITRTVLEDMRVGVGEGSIRDAIVWAFFGKELKLKYDKEKNNIEFPEKERKHYDEMSEIVQNSYDLLNDFSEVAKIAKTKGKKGLEAVKLSLGVPVKVMLFQKAKDMDDAFETVGKPAAVEFKYDGFRLMVSKNKDKVDLFTRRLDNVSNQFPEVVKYIKENVKGDNFILDGEAVGFDPKNGKYLPFQSISQRIKRKYDIDKMARDFPVELNVFDIIYYNGKALLKEPFKKRRELIEKIVNEKKKKIVLSKCFITDDLKKAQDFYAESLKSGNEGVMVKNLEAVYKPGSRVGYGVKVKPVMESLDLVIVGAEWGSGKRSEWLSSFVIACVEDGKIRKIGKVGTGIKEKEEEGVSFVELTKMLKPLITSEKGKEINVKPKIVIEVDYEEIQKSSKYSSGYALRFPRLVRLRPEKGVNDASSLKFVEQLYEHQRGRKV